MELLHFAKSRRGGELIGIVVLAAGVSLGAALVTYHPDDSSAFYTSTNNAISNAIGYYGATVAWIFVGFLGFASLLFPLGLLVIGWQKFWGNEVEYLQSEIKRDVARVALSATQRQLIANLQEYYATVQTAQQELQSLDQSVDAAAESLHLTKLRYQGGEGLVLEVVDAQNTYVAAQNAREDGRVRYQTALANLQTLTGTM